MKYSEDLFKLVKSLDKNEKRYFRLFASMQKGEKNYLNLFEIIASQESYDEAAVKRHFHKEKFINQLTVTKNYLYNLIMRSLSAYHGNNSVDGMLREFINQVGILYQKGLYSQAIKMLQRARRIAVHHEKHIFLLEILRWEELAARNHETNYEKLKKLLEQNVAEQKDIIEKQAKLNRYKRLYTQSYLLERKGSMRDKKDLAKIAPIAGSPLMRDERNANSLNSKSLYHHIFSNIYYLRGDYEKANQHTRQRILLLEKHPETIREEFDNYIGALSNHVMESRLLRNYTESLSSLSKLKHILYHSKVNKTEQARLFEYIYIIETDIHIHTGQFESGISLIPEIEKGLSLYEKSLKMSQLITLHFNIANIYFGAKQYNRSLSWLNRVINETNNDTRQDVYSFARIFNLIIHYELGNTGVLEYFVKSVLRFLYKRNRLYKFEALVLNFILKTLPSASSAKELTPAFRLLREKLINISRDPLERRALEYFDFISWLESKIENRPFADIVREKVGRR